MAACSGNAQGDPVVAGNGKADSVESDAPATAEYGAEALALTTVGQRIVGLLPAVAQKSGKARWGLTTPGPGESHLYREDLAHTEQYNVPVAKAPITLLSFVGLTDIHIIDEESPARTIGLNGIARDAWRRQECYSTQLLDAMVRKIVKLNALSPVDFVMVTGDVIDNCQKNELAWFLQLMKGGPIVPNSGALEDALAGPNNDPNDGFVAQGLGTIPWYSTVGNHDGLIQGNLAVSEKTGYASYTGDPTRDEIRNLSPARVNVPTCLPIPDDEAQEPARCTAVSPKELKRGELVADTERRHLSREDFLAMHVADGEHGYTDENVQSGKGDYVVDPIPTMPIRLIVMDTCSNTGAQGAYTNEQFDNFLEPALQAAQNENRLVIVVSHHSSEHIWGKSGKLRRLLNTYCNVLVHLVGHHHTNQVIAHRGDTPENDYWEVQTCSLAEWPLQSRLFEVVYKGNAEIELWLTMVDFDTDYQGGELAKAARFFALYETQADDVAEENAEGTPSDRNVILPARTTTRMSEVLDLLDGRPPLSSAG